MTSCCKEGTQACMLPPLFGTSSKLCQHWALQGFVQVRKSGTTKCYKQGIKASSMLLLCHCCQYVTDVMLVATLSLPVSGLAILLENQEA